MRCFRNTRSRKRIERKRWRGSLEEEGETEAMTPMMIEGEAGTEAIEAEGETVGLEARIAEIEEGERTKRETERVRAKTDGKSLQSPNHQNLRKKNQRSKQMQKGLQ